MPRRHPRAATLAVSVVALSLGLSACGSSSLSSDSGSTESKPAASETVDAALAAKLPEKIKTAKKIVIGTDATYAPNEFLADDGKTVQGMDVDIIKALGQSLGVAVEFRPAKFDAIILGVNSGKYDMGVSSFTINAERKKSANMISYFSAGTQWAAAKGNPKKVNPDKACGLNIAVQKGTTQLDDITARSKKCTAAGGQAINLIVEEGQDKVTSDVVSGKADAMLADSPVGLYAIKQTGGQLEPIGTIYDSAPYGIVIPKGQTEFASTLVQALKGIDTSGAYKRALASWGNESGAITDFAVNP